MYAVPRHLLVALTLTVSAASAVAQDSSRTAGQPRARVTVSQHEFRVLFPPDTATTWGWSGQSDPGYYPLYAWSVQIDGMHGPQRLSFIARRDTSGARRFTSLDSLVAQATSSLCNPIYPRPLKTPPY